MTGWYYSHNGVTYGPLSIDEIKDRAARKLLVEDDLIWSGPDGRQDATPAQVALDFSKLPLVASPKPEWLDDVALVESKGPLPGPTAGDAPPEWLEDLRLWCGLELYAAAQSEPAAAAGELLPGALPDWLEGWREPEPPAKTAEPRPPAAPPAGPPLAKPVTARPAASTVVGASPTTVLAEKTIKETGFDLKTGQIVDAERFRQWQKAQHSQRTLVSNQSLFEVFRKARTAVENWVDDDSRRSLVLAGDLAVIKRDPSLTAIFRQFQGYGSSMQEKLTQHLEFMVQNRRKYYAACGT
jgi:hypothetical protein